MSALRRRFLSRESSPSRTPSPAPTDARSGTDNVSIPIDKLHKLNQHIQKAKQQKSSKRRNLWIFGLGSIVGICVALFFAQSNDVVDLAYLKQMNLDSLLDVLPAGLLKDAQDMQVSSIIALQTPR